MRLDREYGEETGKKEPRLEKKEKGYSSNFILLVYQLKPFAKQVLTKQISFVEKAANKAEM